MTRVLRHADKGGFEKVLIGVDRRCRHPFHQRSKNRTQITQELRHGDKGWFWKGSIRIHLRCLHPNDPRANKIER
jgi:hypothetical protein